MKPPVKNPAKPEHRAGDAEAETLLDRGIALHQKGQFAEAQEIYQKILQTRPDHFDALHLLGVIASQGKNYPRAVELIDRALKINPKNADAHNDRGNALQDLGRTEEALASYDQAITLRPNYPPAHYNRGNVLKDLGRPEQALASYDQAIKSKPDHALAYNNRGNVLQDLGRTEEALASYHQAITLQPDYPQAYYNRGVALQDLGRTEEALASYDRAIALNPDYSDAHKNRGNVLRELGRAEEALASYDRVIALNPGHATAHNNRGNALQDLGRTEEALASYDRAIALNPDYSDAHYNRGLTLRDLTRLDEALASCRRAIALDPGHNDAEFNISLVLLLLGRFEEAWPLYELRLVAPRQQGGSALVEANLNTARMGKESVLAHGPLLILGEQGLGDEIMFSSIMPDILGLQSQTILTSDPRLTGLFARSFPGLTACAHPPRDGGVIARIPVERRFFITSLMKFFRRRREDFPGTPYLVADPERRGGMRARLDSLGEGRKIGIMWRGGVGGQREHLRSLTLDDLLPVLQAAGTHWVSLNHLPAADGETMDFTARTGIKIHHWPEVLRSDDYDDTAALLAELDSVVSVTGTVAHCAAALGVSTHVLVNRAPEWRYGNEAAAMPWYRTMTLYRETDHWPIEAMGRELRIIDA